MSVAKLQALLSHNFWLAWSYKLNFFTRYLAAVIAVLLYYFLDRLLQLSGQAAFDGGTYFSSSAAHSCAISSWAVTPSPPICETRC